MKSIIKICNMNSQKDVKNIQETITKIPGIIATEVSVSKKEVVIIYNNSFVNTNDIINSIEDLGYITK